MILRVTPSLTEIVETENSTYRRYPNGDWDILYGESWESFYECQNIEREYQEYKKSTASESGDCAHR